MLTVTSNILEYRQKQRPSVHVATTLYDLIDAVSEQVPLEEEYLLTPAVLVLPANYDRTFNNNRVTLFRS